MRSPGVGAWRGARSLGCGSAIAEIAGCVHGVNADGRPMPDDGALTRRRHKGYRLINTNILLQSIHRQKVCGLGVFRISGSRRRLDRIWCRPLQATGLWFECIMLGGIDLPAGLWMACGLNSRQINHLQLSASETHYRGQSGSAAAPGENPNGRRRQRGSAAGQLPDAPSQGRA